eukprot:PhM_4_TR17450/c3_g1_i7/m.36610
MCAPKQTHVVPSTGPVVVNHVARRIYFASRCGTMFGHPIPGEGTGVLKLMAGELGCYQTGCRGTAVGTFAQTRFKLPTDMHGSAYLHPLYLVYDLDTYRVVAMDVGNSTSSYYAGVGSTTYTDSFNNEDKLNAQLPYRMAYSGMKSDASNLYLCGGCSVARISLTTGVVTSALKFVDSSSNTVNLGDQHTIALYNGYLYIWYKLYPKSYITTTPIIGAGSSNLDVTQYTWEVPPQYIYAFPVSSTNAFPSIAVDNYGFLLRYHFSTNVWERSTQGFGGSRNTVDVHGEYLYTACVSRPSCRLRLFAPTRSPTATIHYIVTPTRTSTHTTTLTPSISIRQTPSSSSPFTPTSTFSGATPSRTSIHTTTLAPSISISQTPSSSSPFTPTS